MSILNNYPRYLPNVEVLSRKYRTIKKAKNQELFIRWLEEKIFLYGFHHGDTARIIVAEFLGRIKNDLYHIRPSYCYHEKSKAWRIARNANHGGTPWRPEHFDTEEDCLEFIEKHNLISDF